MSVAARIAAIEGVEPAEVKSRTGAERRAATGFAGGACGGLLRAAGALPKRQAKPEVAPVQVAAATEEVKVVTPVEVTQAEKPARELAPSEGCSTRANSEQPRSELCTSEPVSGAATPAVMTPRNIPVPESEVSSPAPAASEDAKDVTPVKEDFFSPLPMTPRGGESAEAQSPEVVKETKRRQSRVSFADAFGLQTVIEVQDDEQPVDDFFDECAKETDETAEDHAADASPESSGPTAFAIEDSDDESQDCDDDLDDLYDFDHDKLAAMVKAGADRHMLVEAIQEAMATQFEQKMKDKAERAQRKAEEKAAKIASAANKKEPEEIPDVTGAMTPPADVEGSMTPTGDKAITLPADEPAEVPDVTGAMTPPAEKGAMTPTAPMTPRAAETPKAAETPQTSSPSKQVVQTPMTPQTPLNEEEVAQRCRAAMEAARNRRRRSSAIKKNGGDIAAAMQQAAERRRRSVAEKMAASPDAAIREAMDRARGRHRQSISKAAEILDDADMESAGVGVVSAKMQLVSQAMEDARRRHRKSISDAVNKLNAGAADFTPGAAAATTSATASASSDSYGGQTMNSEARVQQAVYGAYNSYNENQSWYDNSGCDQYGYEQGYQQGYQQGYGGDCQYGYGSPQQQGNYGCAYDQQQASCGYGCQQQQQWSGNCGQQQQQWGNDCGQQQWGNNCGGQQQQWGESYGQQQQQWGCDGQQMQQQWGGDNSSWYQ